MPGQEDDITSADLWHEIRGTRRAVEDLRTLTTGALHRLNTVESEQKEHKSWLGKLQDQVTRLSMWRGKVVVVASLVGVLITAVGAPILVRVVT